MKAALFIAPGKMEVKEIEKPVCKDGEVLIRVKANAVCGTDIRIYKHGHHKVKPPHVIGHELCGYVEDFGKDIKGYKKRDKVILVTEIGCGHCDFCIRGKQNLCPEMRAIGYYYPGGYAEYILVPREAVTQGNVIKIPESTDENEATLIEPLSCVINGQDYLNIDIGDTVVVIGAGPIGCMHTEVARFHGAAKVILSDISKDRLKMAERFRVDRIVNSKEEDLKEVVLKETRDIGADVVIIACSSKEAQESSLDLVGMKGRISFFGGLPKDNPNITINSNTLHYKELSVFGAYSSYPYQYVQAMSLIASKKIDGSKFVTAKYPLDKIVDGLNAGMTGKELKVVINP